jgi:hypothetical protein
MRAFFHPFTRGAAAARLVNFPSTISSRVHRFLCGKVAYVLDTTGKFFSENVELRKFPPLKAYSFTC